MSRGDAETMTLSFRRSLVETMSIQERDDSCHCFGCRETSRRISTFGNERQSHGSLLAQSAPWQAASRAYIVNDVESMEREPILHLFSTFLTTAKYIIILFNFPFLSALAQEFDMPARVLPESTVRPVWTSDNGSMARETALTRWPRLVQGMIDDVTATAKISVKLRESEAEELITQLMSLKDDIIADAALK
jgi:hypothetical protein